MAETVSSSTKKKAIVINKNWCKGCGICASLCSRVLAMDSTGKAVAVNPYLCTGCRVCESHCPDFAISIGVEGIE
ncbi:MAG: 4Fe-4S binding protein [Pelotomaculum sp.]|nr:4Fe-4S binding protein [Pelotomaculum sp.]